VITFTPRQHYPRREEVRNKISKKEKVIERNIERRQKEKERGKRKKEIRK
jgi:hypothetical protein